MVGWVHRFPCNWGIYSHPSSNSGYIVLDPHYSWRKPFQIIFSIKKHLGLLSVF